MADALLIDMTRRHPGGAAVRIRLEVPLGEALVTVLFGESGSGKTTVLRCLAGLDRPDEGRVACFGETWSDAGAGLFVPPQRRRLGFLFQEYALFPHFSVRRNIAHGLHALSREERGRRIDDVSRLLRIQDLLDRRPSQLSGGQRQRVALARTLAPRPRLLLLDEPFSAIDTPTREELRGELRRVLEAFRIPAVLVTHDRDEALTLGDRMAVLIAGQVRQVGPVAEVFDAPRDREVARLVGVEGPGCGRAARRSARPGNAPASTPAAEP
jgi:molybdate transport system ATP-binding protein